MLKKKYSGNSIWKSNFFLIRQVLVEHLRRCLKAVKTSLKEMALNLLVSRLEMQQLESLNQVASLQMMSQKVSKMNMTERGIARCWLVR